MQHIIVQYKLVIKDMSKAESRNLENPGALSRERGCQRKAHSEDDYEQVSGSAEGTR